MRNLGSVLIQGLGCPVGYSAILHFGTCAAQRKNYCSWVGLFCSSSNLLQKHFGCYFLYHFWISQSDVFIDFLIAKPEEIGLCNIKLSQSAVQGGRFSTFSISSYLNLRVMIVFRQSPSVSHHNGFHWRYSTSSIWIPQALAQVWISCNVTLPVYKKCRAGSCPLMIWSRNRGWGWNDL